MGVKDEAAGRMDGIAGGGAVEVFRTQFTALNNSGVAGDAVLVLDRANRTLDIDIDAQGLEPGQIHPQHVHGFADGTDARSPTIAQDADGDGFVELAEGLATYGPVQLNLTLNPENSAHDHGADGHDHTAAAVFPTVGGDGVLSYHETFRFDPDDANARAVFDSIAPLGLKEVVLHGQTVAVGAGAGTGLEVDGSGGYKMILPVASGELEQVGGSVRVYATEFTALNDSGVRGDALVFLDQVTHDVTVRIHAEGLEPGQVHPQHIHGFTDGRDARTPGLAQDADGDGFVELAEGLATYGPVRLNLALNPGNPAGDHGADGHGQATTGGPPVFPTVGADGVLDYQRTFHFDRDDPDARATFAAITPLDAKEVVLHGLSLQQGQGSDGGEADGTAGYKTILPVASGELQDVTGAFLAAGAGGSADWHLHG